MKRFIILSLVGIMAASGAGEDDATVPAETELSRLILKRDLDEAQHARLEKLTPGEFPEAVALLEANRERPYAARYVWLVAANFNRLKAEVSKELLDRAALALVKATDVENRNRRLHHLRNLEGVNDPSIKELAQRLSTSNDEYTALQAKKNLQILSQPPKIAPPPAAKDGIEPSGEAKETVPIR